MDLSFGLGARDTLRAARYGPGQIVGSSGADVTFGQDVEATTRTKKGGFTPPSG